MARGRSAEKFLEQADLKANLAAYLSWLALQPLARLTRTT